MSAGARITEMYAFLVADDDGGEGVPAFEHDGVMMPLVAADSARVASLRQVAHGIARNSGRPVTLARFSTREDLETIRP